MKIVVLTIVLCGAVSADISKIINTSREYLPPSREYLPPLLPENLQSALDTSTYVQDPPIVTNLVEVLSTNVPDNWAADNYSQGEEVYIPVEVIIEKNGESESSIRQYLPPVTISTTVLLQSSETTIELAQTTPQVVVKEVDNEVSTPNTIQSTDLSESTPDTISSDDNKSTIPSHTSAEGPSRREKYEEQDYVNVINPELRETVFTTTIPNIAPITTESIVSTTSEIVTLRDDYDITKELSNDGSTLTTKPTDSASVEVVSTSATDNTQSASSTENISSTQTTVSESVDTVSTINDVDDIQKVSAFKSIETPTINSIPANVDSTEGNTEGLQTISTTIGIDSVSVDFVNTESNLDVIQQVSMTEDTPTTTSSEYDGTLTTESEPVNNLILSTTIPEYIQNGQELQIATEQTTSESKNSVRSNNFEANEVKSEVIEKQNEVSAPETLLLEDGYHYTIPTITFVSKINK